jgi:hypothetical protein
VRHEEERAKVEGKSVPREHDLYQKDIGVCTDGKVACRRHGSALGCDAARMGRVRC